MGGAMSLMTNSIGYLILRWGVLIGGNRFHALLVLIWIILFHGFAMNDHCVYETLESHNDNHRTVCQFPLEEFCPEKAKGKKQKLIIYILLFQLYRYHLAKRNGEPTPPSIFMFAEGLPGTGKSRMLKTMRNIVRLVKDSNYSELTSAPTGVAASLIEGTTHCRSCSIPTGKEFSKVPAPISCSKRSSLQHMLSMHRHLFLWAFDEHSMTGRKSFGWLKHRLEELRSVARTYDAAGNLVPNLDSNQPSIPDDVSFRPFGGVPFIFSCGDHAQLPPVLDKLMYDTSPAKPNTADMCGKIAFSQFLNSDDESEIESTVVILDEVLRQDDPIFLGFLQRMRGGNLNMDNVALIRSRCLETLDETEQAAFKDAIHITSTWNEASKISFEYLCRLNVPIAKIRARYSTSRNDGKNCCLKESSYPSRLALGVGAKVMLLKNFIVEEWHILNGSMGTVVDIIYDHKDGPMAPGNPLPLFVVVDFPSSNVPGGHKSFPNAPSSFVAIPVVCERCKNNCCSIETIPPRVFIAITIYKSQGITVGDGEMFQKIVVHLPMYSKRIVPGLELVAFSCAKGLECLAILGNAANDLVTDRLVLIIGKSKGNQAYKDFMAMLANKEQQTFDKFGDMITKLDDSDGANEATFEGGCDFLLRWYHSMIDSNVP
jgi:PIF1 helicase.